MKSPRILIIDDEESIRESLHQYLEMTGYAFDSAESPGFCQGIERQGPCRKTRPSGVVFLADLNMPVMNGSDILAGRDKRGGKGSQAPAALMTALLPRGKEARLARFGCQSFQKPVLFATIQKWIESLPGKGLVT